MDQARFDEAEKLIREALDQGRHTLPKEHPAIAAATDALGRVLEEKGEYDQALPILQEAVRLRSKPQTEAGEMSASMYELANVYFYSGRYRESEALNRKVLEISRREFGERHPRVEEALTNLGAIQQDLR